MRESFTQESPAPAVPEDAQPHTDLRLPSVLLVDDDESMRALTRDVLKRSKQFRVVAEAETAPHAIRQARIHQPDLILLDINLPGMDGLEALPMMRRAAPSAQVALFSFGTRDAEADLLRLGVAACIAKEDPWDEIVEQLTSIVPQSHAGIPEPDAEAPQHVPTTTTLASSTT